MESALTWTAWTVDLSKSAKLGKPRRLVGCPRGVPVNKTGVPLVGNVDPAAVAANFKKDTSAKSEEKKGKKKDPLVLGSAVGMRRMGITLYRKTMKNWLVVWNIFMTFHLLGKIIPTD